MIAAPAYFCRATQELRFKLALRIAFFIAEEMD
jgi:hypothetical protein